MAESWFPSSFVTFQRTSGISLKDVSRIAVAATLDAGVAHPPIRYRDGATESVNVDAVVDLLRQPDASARPGR